MSEHNPSKALLTVVIFITSLFISSVVYAQFPENPAIPLQGGGTNGGGGGAASYLVGGYGQEQQGSPKSSAKGGNLQLFVKSPSYEDNALTSLYYYYLFNQMVTTTAVTASLKVSSDIDDLNADKKVPADLTGSLVYNLLTTTQSSLQTLSSTVLDTPVTLDASANLYYISDNTAKTIPNPATPNVADINMNSLIGPTMYLGKKEKGQKLNTQEQNAIEFINNITDQYTPLAVINFSKISSSDLTTALSNSSVQQYINAVRNQVAGYSVGISNLVQLYSERRPRSTKDFLGNAIPTSLPTQLQQEISPLAFDQWQAERRVMNPTGNLKNKNSWYMQMEKATPATLQREMVYLLAEIRYELFKTRMTDERILATLSVSELQSATGQNFPISQLRNNICGASPFKGSGACPPLPTPPSSNSSS